MNDLKIHDEIRKESLIFVKENMKVKLDGHDKHSQSYISPRISSEFMDCSMPMTFDSYSHCSLGCTYCFAYAQEDKQLVVFPQSSFGKSEAFDRCHQR
jgi:sulfatase maturation enzyme AslB (radical SAM superfamily)